MKSDSFIFRGIDIWVVSCDFFIPKHVGHLNFLERSGSRLVSCIYLSLKTLKKGKDMRCFNHFRSQLDGFFWTLEAWKLLWLDTLVSSVIDCIKKYRESVQKNLQSAPKTHIWWRACIFMNLSFEGAAAALWHAMHRGMTHFSFCFYVVSRPKKILHFSGMRWWRAALWSVSLKGEKMTWVWKLCEIWRFKSGHDQASSH